MKRAIAILTVFFILTQGAALAGRTERGRIDRRTMAGYRNIYNCSTLTANAALKLTAEQAARICSLDEKYAPDIESVLEELFGKGRELKSAWLQMEPDRGRIEALQAEAAILRKRLRASLAARREEILKILAPEQRALMPDAASGCIFYKPAGFGRR
jgi:Spy/CpxP family protein refolding chaperone